MMLVQKAQAIAISTPSPYSHRRHPSAPVVVQPTRIPGLLSLSKPARQPQPHQRKQPAPKKPVLPAPSPEHRGRSQGKKPQQNKSPSSSLLRGKHGRQPSPPQVPSQAEVPVPSSNSFDPFSSPPPSPSISGKLAQRRKPIPVPSLPRNNNTQLARSDPLPSTVRPRPLPKRSSTINDFPVCDDMNEPVTPTLTPRRLYDTGPKTAPISARTPGAFPFADLAMVTPPKKNRKHRRTPSEGMFHMSSDEELSSGPAGALFNTKPLTPFVTPTRAVARAPSPGSLATVGEADEKLPFFASSMFQNSPSPEELPDPLLL